jgi:photosystem II stability/assembly factor-like uncharacterized protein
VTIGHGDFVRTTRLAGGAILAVCKFPEHFISLFRYFASFGILFDCLESSEIFKKEYRKSRDVWILPDQAINTDSENLQCYTNFDPSGQAIIEVARSTDNGGSWTTIGSVASAPTATKDIGNCNIHQLPSGRIVTVFRNHDKNGPTSYTYYRLTICFSDDGGNNWSYLSTPRESGTIGLGLWEPFLYTALDGGLQLYYSYETSTSGCCQDSILIGSTDGGVTWGGNTLVSHAEPSGRDGMVGVIRLADGNPNLIAVFESLNPDVGITSVRSQDDGVTWGSRATVYKTPVANANTNAPQIENINNNLVVAFMTDEDSPGARAASKVLVSIDGGNSWGQKATAIDACYWPGLLTIDATHILLTCRTGGEPPVEENALGQTLLLT